jgi:ubiquinone/menaquinone biosynthesis C-methylase UbiE
MKWFPLRKPSGESLPVSMAGIKLGDRLLVVGCADPILIARLAVKTGLTGRAFAVDEQEKAVTAAEEIATREGALIETAKAPWTTLPLEPDSFDVAIVRDVLPHLTKDARSGCISEVLRVLRPGGRCLVIDGRERTGIVAAVRGAPASSDYGAPGGPVHGLTTQGFKAARILAEREGLLFAEAIKANPQSSNH